MYNLALDVRLGEGDVFPSGDNFLIKTQVVAMYISAVWVVLEFR